MRPPFRLAAIAASGSLIAATLAAAAPTTAASSAAEMSKPVRTDFALFAAGYGTRVQGGRVPAGSDGTAFALIGCTTRAGVMRGNYEAEVTVPGLGTLSGVRTRLWTEKKGRVVSSYSKHTVAEVVLASSELGTLSLEGVRSLSRAYHDGSRFRGQTQTSVARIVLDPASGPARTLDIPTPGRPLVVPGLARIAIGNSVKAPITDGLRVTADAIDITVHPTDTRARIAHTSAKIQRGAPFGTFRGYSAGVRARGLGDNVKVGRTPLSLMPCKGTKGKVLQKAVAHVNLNDQLVVRGVDTSQMGRQTRRGATAFEEGNIARVNLGDGRLIITGIVGRANVKRTATSLIRNTKGTTIGSIRANGRTYSFPDSGVLEIPGLVKLQQNVTRRIKHGISVVALRITILGDRGAVVDLGIAETRIRRG